MAALQPMVIVGAGGHGREALDVVIALNADTPTYDVLGVVDDGCPDQDLLRRRAVRFLGGADVLRHLASAFVLGVGNSADRRRLDERLSSWGRAPATLVHPRAVMGSDVVLGPGAVVSALASLSTNVHTGCHLSLNIAATVAHDCRLGDYVTIAPGAHLSGAVIVGHGAQIGSGAVVRQGIAVGAHSVVGAGAVVVRDVPPGVTVTGIPARPLR